MPTQIRNDDQVGLLEGDFQKRYEPNFAWKSACSAYMFLPGLRGFWPMSSVSYTNPICQDVSGNGNHLTNNNNGLFSYDQLYSFVSLDGSTEYLSKADGGAGNWADITGTNTTEPYIAAAKRGITAYAWVYFDDPAGNAEMVLSKWTTTAIGNQRSYRIKRETTGEIIGSVSVDGIAIVNVTSTATPSDGLWYFLALQYDPSTELSIWVNDEKTTLAVGVPASAFDSSALFALGRRSDDSSWYLDGRLSLVALCASFHSDSIITAVYQQTRAMFNV